MVLYVLETEGGELVRKFFKETESRLSGGDLLTNPFSEGVVKSITSRVWMVNFKPVYPPVWLFGFVWSGISLLFGFGWWAVFPALILFLQGLMFLPAFYVFMNIRGLRKKGYTGVVKWLSLSEAVKRYV